MLRVFTVVLLLCFITLPVFAQVATAELSGTVLDPTGASVPNAKVTATNNDTGRVFQTTSNSTGNYVIQLLPPGTYTITVEATSFHKLVQRNVTLAINQQAGLDFKLQVGQVNELVEVTGQAPLLETESSSLGTVVNEQFVNQLPLNGRNFIQMATLSPGVNGVGFSATGTIMIRMEDAELEHRFGPDYIEYKQEVPAVIPRL